MWKTEYVNKNLLQELAPFYTMAKLADPTYDADDVVPAFLINGGTVGGRKTYLEGPTSALYGIPFGAETSILAYRKDIFEKHGLEVPTTYDELIETAQFITENEEDVYGFTSRGAAGHQINAGYLLHLSPYGGTVLDDEWNPVFNNEKGVAAAVAFQKLLENSPPGVLSYGYGEMSNAFVQGEAAMYLDSHKIAAISRDPNQSRVDGKVGYALHPVHETCGSETGGFAMGIPANAKNKEAAFLFIQWMTSKAQDVKLAEIGGDPMRLSTYADPALQEGRDEYPVVLEQLDCAATDWRPLIAEWGEINVNVMGVALSEAMSGEKGIQDAMNEAADKTRDVMNRSGYYTWTRYKNQ
jgi:multiple sugar transport system substrate-binding protein